LLVINYELQRQVYEESCQKQRLHITSNYSANKASNDTYKQCIRALTNIFGIAIPR